MRTRLSPSRLRRQAGLSLVEMLVAVALLGVIMVGLFAAFNTAQRSLRASTSQLDVLDGGRTTVGLIARELQELTTANREDVLNIIATTPRGAIAMPRPNNDGVQENALQDFWFLTRKNDVWTGVGYFMTIRGEGVGTLYRHTSQITNSLNMDLNRLYSDYTNATPEIAGRVADGLVHLAVRAFNERGEPFIPADSTNNVLVWENSPAEWGFAFTNSALPSYLEIECGMVDPKLYNQFKVFSNSPVAQVEFLRNQVGKVHLFRQRIPIRHEHEL